MSQQPEDLLTAPLEQYSKSARILPFERPLSDAQKAVQLRAQESMELSRQRTSKKAPLSRWIIGLTVAVVPVLVTVTGLDGFLRAFHHFNEMYAKMPDKRPAPVQSIEPIQTEPGVVMLRPVAPVQEAGSNTPARQ